MRDMTLELAALLVSLNRDQVHLTADEIAVAQSRELIVAPGFNGSLVIESRARAETVPAPQGTLFAEG